MSAPFLSQSRLARAGRGLAVFTFTLLVIEFMDEIVFGAREAAWPLIRTELGLSYAQIGLLLGVPNFLANFIEPVLGLLSDRGHRRWLVLGGGVCFALTVLGSALAPQFEILLVTFIVMAPASGAFVSLSQATLMDLDPHRHEQWMARWTLAGSVGMVAGPLALGVAQWLGAGWRGVFYALAAMMVLLTLILARQPFPQLKPSNETQPHNGRGWRTTLGRREVWKWLTLLLFSDLMLDVMLGFLALYCVDVVGVSAEQGALAVAVWTGVGLMGDALLIPLLERVRGLDYLRVSVFVMLFLYPAFLLVPDFWLKLVLLGLIGICNAGWYAILKAQLYAALPGQSGLVIALSSVFGGLVAVVALGLGLLAEATNLTVVMWCLLAGPLALLVGLRKGTVLSAPASMKD